MIIEIIISILYNNANDNRIVSDNNYDNNNNNNNQSKSKSLMLTYKYKNIIRDENDVFIFINNKPFKGI
jgi:hypothetical protein